YNRLDGQGPNAGVIKDANGILYGTTSSGGSADNLRGFGTVFKLKPAADETQWYETILYRFQGGADGESPSQALTLDAAGALYGTTNGGTGTCTDPVNGGVSSCGMVFELTPAPGHPMWTKTTLYTFTGGTDGGKPYAKLLL